MSALTRWERGAYGLSALLAISSMIVLPIVRAVDPVLAVAIDYESDLDTLVGVLDHTEDPWGRPWRSEHDRGLYSLGPDGIDSSGGGDDITPHDYYAHPFCAWTPPEVLGWPRLTLVVAGLALAVWTFVTREAIRAPPARRVVEALRAAFIAAVPATVGFLWVIAGIRGLDQRFAASGAGGYLQVPASAAIPLTWALLCYLPALAWRITRPRDTPPP